MSQSHYDSIMETMYLLRSPENAKHLADAIAREKLGSSEQHYLIDA